MATQFWSTVMDQNTDAGFRNWGAELNAKLVAAGLVQTADTGQINWTTVTRAATNTDAGYEIWRFNDTQQGTAPIFIRLHFGSGSAQNIPRIRVIVGTSTNGAGTLGGAVTTVRTVSSVSGVATGLVNMGSYLCVADGHFGLVWKDGAVLSSGNPDYAWAGFTITRSCDTNGVADARGCFVNYHSNSGSSATDMTSQSIRFTATAIVYAQQSLMEPIYCPGNVTSSQVGTDFQMYLAWMINPQVLTVFGLAGAFKAELNYGVTATVTLIGVTSRTYIQMGFVLGQSSETATIGLCMLWE